MSFYTTEEQIHELFSRCGEIRRIVMGLDKFKKTPCGFCFMEYYARDDAENAMRYINGTRLDDRIVVSGKINPNLIFEWIQLKRFVFPLYSYRSVSIGMQVSLKGVNTEGANRAAKCVMNTELISTVDEVDMVNWLPQKLRQTPTKNDKTLCASLHTFNHFDTYK